MTEAEQKQLLSLLEKLEPGFYPIEIFWQFARLSTMPTIEFVPFRYIGESLEVLLLPRADDDKFWPGMMHIPGCVIRPNDTRDDVFARIMHDELLDVSLGEPTFVATHVRKTTRGNEHAEIYCAEVLGEPKVGKFYDVQSLPENIIDVYRNLIAEAAKVFTKE
jgi:hypothetical protein